MSCECIFQNIAASFPRLMLEKIFAKHRMPYPEEKYGQVALYQEAHKRCHHDGPFARHLQRYLTHQHALSIKRVATSSPELVRMTVEAMLMANDLTAAEDVAGFLWAITSDPRPELRAVEQGFVEELHLLSHRLLLAQLQGGEDSRKPDKSAADADVSSCDLEQKVQQLTAECRTLTTSLQRLEQQREQLTQENAYLQQALKALNERCALSLQPESTTAPSIHPDKQTRTLRKLQYQVDKLTALVQEKDREHQRLMALMAYDAISPIVTVPEAAEPENPAPSLLSLSAPILHGKTIALIGGIGKASPHYAHVIQALGGGCLQHDGDLRRGRKRLAEIIKKADIVFCPVDCNSHGAATSTKKLCKALQKPCYFLRSSGITHVRDKLIEIAQTGAPPTGMPSRTLDSPISQA
jgi:outer membrane murein-binding lipoprotein Lpp